MATREMSETGDRDFASGSDNEYHRRARSLAEDPRTRAAEGVPDLLLKKAQVWATLAVAEEMRMMREGRR